MLDSNVRYEENPFEDPVTAKQWINSIENEKGRTRDLELYPMLEAWVKEIRPQLIVDIGAGQDVCAPHLQFGETRYIGIEPSKILVNRAIEKYSNPHRKFILGDAFSLDLPNAYADAVISVNVWFHLKELEKASDELSRILKSEGHFLVSTANPNAYHIWRTWYSGAHEDEKKIDGQVNIPINPLSRNILYKHSQQYIVENLKRAGLKVEKMIEFGFTKEGIGPAFVSFYGTKK